MITQEQIEANKTKAMTEYQARKLVEKQRSDELKAGVKYIHDRGLPVHKFFFDDHWGLVVFMTWETKEDHLLFAFAFRGPKDEEIESLRIAKGILGMRLQTNKHTILCENLPGKTDDEIALLGRCLLTVAAIEGTNIPDCVKKAVKKTSKDNVYSGTFIECPRKPLKRLPE